MFILGLKVGNTTDPSLWIMGGCDSLSPLLLGLSSSFPFCGSAWTHYKAMKGYELLSTPTRGNRNSLHLHKQRHKYMRQTQTHGISTQKSPQSLTHAHSFFTFHWTVAQAFPWLSPEDVHFHELPCESFYSTSENSIISRAAHRQLRLSLPTSNPGFKLSPDSLAAQ